MKNLNPVVCTLSAAQLGRRSMRWKDALARYIRKTNRIPGGLSIELKRGAPMDEFLDLIRLESECCKWMDIELNEDDSGAKLTITAATDEGVDALSGILRARCRVSCRNTVRSVQLVGRKTICCSNRRNLFYYPHRKEAGFQCNFYY